MESRPAAELVGIAQFLPLHPQRVHPMPATGIRAMTRTVDPKKQVQPAVATTPRSTTT
jgi:hypothetical protein